MKSLLSYTVLLILLLACSTQGRENPEPKSVPPTPTLTAVPPTPTPKWLPNSALEPSPTPVKTGLDAASVAMLVSSATPQPIPTPSIPLGGLGIRLKDVQEFFEHEFMGGFVFESSSAPDGTPQTLAISQKGDALLHLLGKPDHITQASMTVLAQESTRISAGLHFQFLLGQTVPDWVTDKRPFWVGDSLDKYLETLEDSSYVEDGKRVTLGGNETVGVIWLKIEVD